AVALQALGGLDDDPDPVAVDERESRDVEREVRARAEELPVDGRGELRGGEEIHLSGHPQVAGRLAADGKLHGRSCLNRVDSSDSEYGSRPKRSRHRWWGSLGASGPPALPGSGSDTIPR